MDGLGADAVFDTVGGAEPLRSALVGAESGGKIVVVSGIEAGQVIITPDPKPAQPQKK